MSNVTPIYTSVAPGSYTGTTAWPWIIVIIILLIVIIVLAIWLAVRYNSGNNNNNRQTGIQGGTILSSSSSITGKWGLLTNENDKVTLYVSVNPLVFNSDGTATSSGVLLSSKTGSNNSVTINALTVDTLYYAALVATGPDTNHYSIFGPVRVYTQETADLSDHRFNILNINSSGGVSSEGTYTEKTPYGIFAFDKTNSYLVKYDNETDVSDPELVLCRNNASGITDTSVFLTEVSNIGPNGIPKSNCQWSYNDTPPVGADGKNLWCLTASQNTSSTNANAQTLCLARNGNSLNVVSPSTATVWYNPTVNP